MDYELPLGRCQPSEIQGFGILLLTQQFFIISTLVISLTVTAKPIPFSERTQEDISGALKYFAQTNTNLLLS